MISVVASLTNADIWAFVSQNALVSAIIAGLIVAFGTWLFVYSRARRDSNAIYAFLRQSAEGTPHTFRTTHAIAAATRIPESRVAELASRDTRIKRNEQERQSWHLT